MRRATFRCCRKGMPYLETVQELLEAKEGEHVQFKEAKNRFDFGEAAKCCCALANNSGGKLVFGITDKRPRRVVGSAAFDQPERTRMGLIEKLKVNVDFQLFNHDGNRVLVFDVNSRPIGLPVQYDGISSDIEQLCRFGMDICVTKSTQNWYFMNGRLFDIPELKLLIEAVESSKFITEKKSKELVEKLGMLASKHSAADLKRNLCIEGRLKPSNEQLYYIADALNGAINQGKKVSFQYFQYNVRKEQKLRHDGEVYVFSPYTLVWNGDYYYVVGYSDKHQNIGSFRIDRIYQQPKILKENAVPHPEGFNKAEYVRTMFRMYSKKPEVIELICDNSTMDTIIDKFGKDVKTYAYSLSAFKAEVEVAASHVFYSWVFGFGGKVKIKGPENVKREYKEMIQAAAADF